MTRGAPPRDGSPASRGTGPAVRACAERECLELARACASRQRPPTPRSRRPTRRGSRTRRSAFPVSPSPGAPRAAPRPIGLGGPHVERFRGCPTFRLLLHGVRRTKIELFRNFRKRISYFRCRRSAVRWGRVRSCFLAALLANDRARIWRIAPAISSIDTGALGEFYAGLEGGVAPLGRRPENIHTAAAAWVQRCGGPRMTTRGRRAATTPDASRT